MRKVTKNNYRQYYKTYYNIDFGKEYEIHHIDQDRNNNDISNLLLLPSSIHSRFHFCLQAFNNDANNLTKLISPKFDELFKHPGHSYDIDMLNKYTMTLCEIKEWIDYKHLSYRYSYIDNDKTIIL